MTIEDLLQAVDSLAWDDLARLQDRINERRQAALDNLELMAKIKHILQDAKPLTLQAGTMDIDKLKLGVEGMWADLSVADIEAIVGAMREEYIEPDEEWHE